MSGVSEPADAIGTRTPLAPGTVRPGPHAIRIVVALTVAAAALRFATLDVQSIWSDETATVLLLKRPFGDMLSTLGASESAPPLYYVLAWLWTHLFGTGAVGVRSLSALVGVATVPVAWLAARAASERAGLWAAAIAAVNPLTFYYAQEARAYALLILLAGLAFVAFQRALADPTRRSLGAWAVLSALALLTHYFAAFLVVGEALWLLRTIGLRRAGLATAPIALVGVALVPLAIRQRSDGKSDWIEDTSLVSRLAQAPKQFLVGIDSPLEVLAAGAAGLLALGAILLVISRGSRVERRVALLAATVGVVALAIPLALSVSGTIDLFNGRNVVAAWVPVVALVAVGLGTRAASRAGAVLGGALCLVMLATVIGVLTAPAYQRDDYRGIADALPLPRSDRLVVLPSNGDFSLQLVLPRTRVLEGGSVDVRELAIANFGERRIGRPPRSPELPAPPPGFRPAGTTTEGNVAVARFVASTPRRLDVRALERLLDADASALLQPAG